MQKDAKKLYTWTKELLKQITEACLRKGIQPIFFTNQVKKKCHGNKIAKKNSCKSGCK
jgi:hypothetical protein